jgi:predicted nucleotidyltransferase component of viral defense system
MSNRFYPVSLAQIERWRRRQGTSIDEANARFMQFVILDCIASYASLRNNMALKGGNALRLVYQSPRSTKDLDFSIDENGLPDDPDQLREMLNSALRRAEKRFDVRAKCQRVKRKPPRPTDTRPTYDIGVGYQFRDHPYFHDLMNRNVSTVIPLEISFADLVCDVSRHVLRSGDRESIRVCTLEDIVAEKLRALLQQKVRNRNRHQDVHDVAYFARERDHELDGNKVGKYLVEKSAIRDIVVSKSAFDDEIRERAAYEYEKRLREQAGKHFIHFADAWNGVLSLVETLDIPD